MPRAKGFTHSQETKGKMSKSHFGEKHWNWKGGHSKLDYTRVHRWIKKEKGLAKKCDKCGAKNKKYDWSNRSGKYQYELSDWWQLCKSCHRQYDGIWNEGMQGRQRWHNTTGLTKGGWNKGIKTKTEVTCKCGTVFYPPKKSSLFCSKSCASKNR